MINQYLCQEQESRGLEALNALEIELDKNTDIYGAGEFDALIGAEPDPQWAANRLYRQGYQDSFWRLYDEKYGIKLVTEF
ncbi:MAG: hypothetical protein QNJ54_32625 [Prochloraceae cyanobacterium]|nr:hypothetical protein [Prochloraceae cyanobacterium]